MLTILGVSAGLFFLTHGLVSITNHEAPSKSQIESETNHQKWSSGFRQRAPASIDELINTPESVVAPYLRPLPAQREREEIQHAPEAIHEEFTASAPQALIEQSPVSNYSYRVSEGPPVISYEQSELSFPNAAQNSDAQSSPLPVIPSEQGVPYGFVKSPESSPSSQESKSSNSNSSTSVQSSSTPTPTPSCPVEIKFFSNCQNSP